ncbi:MAG: hypothetical protein RMM53_10745 [Bacteroidia bacterium]|nr:hypothetical protein [Bacteroidia bacterium]
MLYQSCRADVVLAKIALDHEWDNPSASDRVLETVFEAMEMLPLLVATQPKIETLEIKDFRACIPDDLIELMNVRIGTKLLVKSDYAVQGLEKDEYNVIPNYIVFGVESGEAEIRYQAWPRDEDGIPMIPCDVFYLDYLSKYYGYKRAYIRFQQGLINERAYETFKRDMEMARWRAKTMVMFPSIDQAEALAAQWRRMIPFLRQRTSMFVSSNREQLRRGWK